MISMIHIRYSALDALEKSLKEVNELHQRCFQSSVSDVGRSIEDAKEEEQEKRTETPAE